MSGQIRIVIDRAAWDGLKKKSADDSAKRAADATQKRIQSTIRSQGRVDTGKMVRSINVQKEGTGRFNVGSDLEYTRYQNDGIGPVRARPGRVLRFKPKGAAGFIFRPRTKGFRGGRFFEKALSALSLRDFIQR